MILIFDALAAVFALLVVLGAYLDWSDPVELDWESSDDKT